MPIYGRYEPAEAMRDLGLSLGKIVTDMAETELQSRKMDLALKESDLKLGMLEKEAQIGTLKTQLEGETRKTSLAQEKEKINLQTIAQAQHYELGKEQAETARGHLKVAQSDLALKQKEYERMHSPVIWREVLPPHLIGVIEQSMGKEFLDQKTTRADAAPVVTHFLTEFKGEAVNVGLLKTRQELSALEAKLKQLGEAAAQGDMDAASAAEKLMAERQKKLQSAEDMINIMSGEGAIDKIFTSIKKNNPEMSDEEALATARQVAQAKKSGLLKVVEGPMDVDDWAIGAGLKKDPNPIKFGDEAKRAVDGIMKKPEKEREAALRDTLNGIDRQVAAKVWRPKQGQIMKEMVLTEWESRRGGKAKAGAAIQPDQPAGFEPKEGTASQEKVGFLQQLSIWADQGNHLAWDAAKKTWKALDSIGEQMIEGAKRLDIDLGQVVREGIPEKHRRKTPSLKEIMSRE